MSVKVSIKWGKEELKDLEIDYSQPPMVFKSQIFSMTGVPIERQKIMVKGGMLKDDADWSTLGLKNGQKLMMMGTADAIPQAPEKEIMFLEDLPEEAQDHADTASLGNGLVNLGNTCYMNSTLQCLHNIPELREAICAFSPTGGPAHSMAQEGGKKLTLATKDLFRQLSTSMAPVNPMRFLAVMRELFPQFAQTGQGGAFMQQDAEECYSQLMYTFRETLKSSATDPLHQMMGVDLVTTLKCAESSESFEERQTVYTLKCNITAEVNHLNDGMKIALLEDREKNSLALGRSALWKGESKVAKLPPALNVQFVRFFWKTNVSAADGTQGMKSKILRKVSFPFVLDMYDFCGPELQAELSVVRKDQMDKEDKLLKKQKVEREADTKEGGASGDVQMSEASSSGVEATAAVSETLTSKQKRMTGHYDLMAVLTHKGRAADSGHYISWVKRENGDWVVCDDDNLSIKKEDDIKALYGGGDFHMAYLCMYKARYI